MAIQFSPKAQPLLQKTLYLYKRDEIETHTKRTRIALLAAVLIAAVGITLTVLKVGGTNAMVAIGTGSAVLFILALAYAIYNHRSKYQISSKDLLNYLLATPEVQRETDPLQRKDNIKSLFLFLQIKSYLDFVDYIANVKNISITISEVENFIAILEQVKSYDKVEADDRKARWADIRARNADFYSALNTDPLNMLFAVGGYYENSILQD